MIDESATNLVVSTAKWIKFTPSMVKAIKGEMKLGEKDEMIALSKEFNSPIPKSISRLFETEAIHKSVVEKDEIKNEIINWIKK